MSFRITEFEPTPNPNAMKCWLDRPISDRPQSYFNAAMAAANPIAAALFEQAGVTNVLLNGDWLTVNKPQDAEWRTVKEKVKRVLRDASAT